MTGISVLERFKYAVRHRPKFFVLWMLEWHLEKLVCWRWEKEINAQPIYIRNGMIQLLQIINFIKKYNMVLILITQKAWIYNDVHIEQNRSIQCFRPVIISTSLSTDVRVQSSHGKWNASVASLHLHIYGRVRTSLSYYRYMIPVTVYYPEAKALLFERARAILNKDKKWKSTKRKINNIIKCLNIFSLRFIIKQTSFDVGRVERLPSINSKCKTVHFKKWSLEDTREWRI